MKTRFLPFAIFLLFSSTAFSQWTPQSTGFATPLRGLWDISIADENTVWAIAYDGADPDGIYAPVPEFTRTTDGGATWTTGVFPAGYFWNNISAVNKDTAWVSVGPIQTLYDGAIFKTTDGGLTWNEQGAGEIFNNTSFCNFVYFWNANEGVAVGDPNPDEFEIYTTTNGGDDWIPTSASAIPNPVSDEFGIFRNYCTLGDHIWFATNKARIYHSADKGLTWTVSDTGIPTGIPTTNSGNAIDIAFWSPDEGIARLFSEVTNTNLSVKRTNNGGLTWESVTVEGPFLGSFFGGLAYVPGTTSTLVSTGVGNDSGIYGNTTGVPGSSISEDGGTTWTLIDTNQHFITRFLNCTTGWSAGFNANSTSGGIFKWDVSRTYVNHAATGNNDGSSWADAYTDLQDALAVAEEGNEIWVAEGIYLPDTLGGDPASNFLIGNDLKLYGGFAGTECNLSERDIVLHPTILSGDLNGDDTPGDFLNNRSDNTIHVMTASDAANGCVIDGFTIQGGAALQGDPPNGADVSIYRGGGIFFRSSGIIRNCTFQDNSGRWGSGCTTDRGDEVTIEDCHFKNNNSELSALYLVGHADARVIGTEFSDNYASEWGGAANVGNSNCSFLDCTFTNNTAGTSIGGAVFIWQNAGTQYPNPEVVFERCTFTGNQSSNSSGGALIVNNFIPGTKVFVDSCEFQGNAAPNVSALYLNFVNGQNCTAQVTNSTFTENTCTDDYAAVAIWTTSPSSADVLVENCVFENNTSTNSGALDIGGAPDTGPDTFVVRNCKMLNNVATGTGGGLTLWSDARSSIAFEIEDCQLIGNSAGETAGAVWLLSSSNNSHAAMRRCVVHDNASPIGGTFGTSQFGLFEAGLPDGSTFLLENSLVTGNTGAGVVMLDSFPGFKILNATLADNEATGILLNELGGVELQNAILHNPGYDEYIAITNDVTVTSNGGNLIGDNSFAAHALTYDQQNADPLFMGTDDYHLSATSPAIDKGVNLDNLPPTDLDGNDRPNGCVDIGAYESDVIVSTDCITSTDEAAIVEMVISPNPTSNFLNIQLPETIAKPNEISLFDTQGKFVRLTTLNPAGQVEVHDLPSGMYVLKAVDGNQVYIGKFVKQ